ncbi:UNVERIFIED_CONTAM: hypothetical protein NCL1_55881 [Trichonephila clavipes]
MIFNTFQMWSFLEEKKEILELRDHQVQWGLKVKRVIVLGLETLDGKEKTREMNGFFPILVQEKDRLLISPLHGILWTRRNVIATYQL